MTIRLLAPLPARLRDMPMTDLAYGAGSGGLMHVNVFRPENLARSVFHAISALVAVAFFELIPSSLMLVIIAGGLATTCWILEILRSVSPALNARLMRVFSKVAHPHEHHRVNSSTWYCTALLGLALTSPPMLASMALLVLGLGDPAAAAVGRRWGRTRLRSGRSVEGSLAFVLVGTLACWTLLAWRYPELSVSVSVTLAVGAALAGALAELGTRSVDDNLVIPLAAAAGAAIVVSTVV